MAIFAYAIIRRRMRRTFEHDCDRKDCDKSDRKYAAKVVHIESLTQGMT